MKKNKAVMYDSLTEFPQLQQRENTKQGKNCKPRLTMHKHNEVAVI